MRILHVVNRLSSGGNGIVNLAIDLALQQTRDGHTVAFAAGQGGNEDLVRSFGVSVLPMREQYKATTFLAGLIQFRRHLREFQPDIVHVHTRMALLFALPWSRLSGVPVVAHLHNVHDKSAHRMGWADRLITVSEAVAQSMREAGVPERKLRTVLNGHLQSSRVPQLSSQTPACLEHPAIVTVGGIYERKGIAELIEAFGQVAAVVPQAHLYLVGLGEIERYKAQSDLLPCASHVHFEGFHALPQSYMLSADIFVLASRRDSCPLVLAEAREAGCAIVASDVDGIPEALDGGAAGMLVPVQNPKKLAEAMLHLLQHDDERRAWQQKAKKNLQRFTISRMAGEVEGIYHELVVKP